MSHAAFIPVSPAPFNFGWKDVEQGLPLATLDEFSAYSGISMKELLEVVIPPRTLKHRRARKQVLSMEESDRLARVARMFELAAKVYGNVEDGRDWLQHRMDRFQGRSPLAMLRSEAGERGVEEFLIQIDEGIFV